MNHDRDVRRLLDAWFAEGPMQVADRVIDGAAARIARQPQRPTWRLTWRPTMNAQLKLAGGVAAVLLVAVVGYNLLPRQSGAGGSPSPSPVPTPASTPAQPPASSASIVDLPDGTLEAGRYRLQAFSDLTIVADVPAGWQGFADVPALVSPGATNNDGATIGFMRATTLFSDPCHWDVDGTGDREQPGDVEVGPTVDDLVAALRSNPAYESSRMEPFVLDEFQAYDFELLLPGDDVLATCDKPAGQSVSAGDFIVIGGGWWAQGADNRWRLFVVDVDGSPLIILLSSFDGTPAADVAAGAAIVESFEFNP